jgi:hypothetical protein
MVAQALHHEQTARLSGHLHPQQAKPDNGKPQEEDNITAKRLEKRRKMRCFSFI